jgi:hypothetical protein
MFGERTGRVFWMFDVGAKAILFEQDQVFQNIRIAILRLELSFLT